MSNSNNNILFQLIILILGAALAVLTQIYLLEYNTLRNKKFIDYKLIDISSNVTNEYYYKNFTYRIEVNSIEPIENLIIEGRIRNNDNEFSDSTKIIQLPEYFPPNVIETQKALISKKSKCYTIMNFRKPQYVKIVFSIKGKKDIKDDEILLQFNSNDASIFYNKGMTHIHLLIIWCIIFLILAILATYFFTKLHLKK